MSATGSIASEIAAAAARLIVEDGMEYGAAKRRVAREMGVTRSHERTLPSNELVEHEVRTYLALFRADTQPAELAALRRLALRWMQRLAEFRPHLGGAVWRGTATRLSAIHLDLYADDLKAAEIALINQGVIFDITEAGTGRRGEPVSVLTFVERSSELGERVMLHLALHDHDDLRGALVPDTQGRSWRGDVRAVEQLLQAGPT
jgi:hypothetical protein